MLRDLDNELARYFILLDHGNKLFYRIAVVVAAICGGLLIRSEARQWPLSTPQKIMIFNVVLLGALCGSFVPALFAGDLVTQINWMIRHQYEGHHLNVLFDFIFGPRTILGGLLFGFFAVAIYKKLLRIDYDTSSAFARGACLSMAIGRLGCHFQHCCFGITVPAPLGIDFGDGQPRLPVQLIESACLFALFGYLQYLHNTKRFEAQRLFILFFLYGLLRFVLEFFRESIASTIMGLGFYQWLALLLSTVGLLQIAKRSQSTSYISTSLS